jgi:hypothetical protein
MSTDTETRDPVTAAIAPDLAHFEATLPPAEYARLQAVLLTQERLLCDEAGAEADRVERVVKEHLPGLRPVLDMLWAHARGCYITCCDHAGGPQQRYRPADPSA